MDHKGVRVEEIGNSGFRFVRIDFLDEGHFVQVLSVRAVAVMHVVVYKGSFPNS